VDDAFIYVNLRVLSNAMPEQGNTRGMHEHTAITFAWRYTERSADALPSSTRGMHAHTSTPFAWRYTERSADALPSSTRGMHAHTATPVRMEVYGAQCGCVAKIRARQACAYRNPCLHGGIRSAVRMRCQAKLRMRQIGSCHIAVRLRDEPRDNGAAMSRASCLCMPRAKGLSRRF
jgi:hypothetical protein